LALEIKTAQWPSNDPAGDAAMHRGFLPTEQELNVALDVVERVFAPIFGHKTEAEKLADRVPPRRPLRS
jgi:hypothetical protein